MRAPCRVQYPSFVQFRLQWYMSLIGWEIRVSTKSDARGRCNPCMDEDDTSVTYKRRHLHIVYMAILTVLAFLLWWPLPRVITYRVPGTPTWAFDESTFLWNVWYFQHALLRLHTSPLYTDLIWHPVGIALILYTYDMIHAILSAPLFWATGNLPLASNVILVLQTVLSGYGTFLLTRYVLRERRHSVADRAAMISGLVYAFASNRSVYAALGHYDMVSTGFIPFYLLALLRTLDALPTRRAYREAMRAGVFFALAALAEMIFAVFLALVTLIVLLTYRTPPRRSLRAWGKRLAVMMVLGVVAAVVWSPVLVPIVRELVTGRYVLQGWGDSIKLSVDLLGFFTPTALHPLWGTDWAQALRAVEEGRSRFSDINTVFLGYVTLGMALVGAMAAGSKRRPWLWLAGIFAVLCLGPFLQVNGRWQFDLDGVPATFPMPFALLHYIPFVRGNRAPNRNSVVLMLALAVLVGYGMAWAQERTRRWGRTVPWLISFGVAVLVLFEHAAVPLPTSDARVPSLYDRIAAEEDMFTLLQVPLGWRNSFGVFGVERTQIQYYQWRHGKPMLGGNISRAPAFKMDYFRRLPLFRAIADVEFGREPEPDVLAQAQAQAGALMRLYNVRYVILFPPIPGRHPYMETWQKTWRFVKDLLPLEKTPFWTANGIEAYRVVQPAYPVASVVDLGTPGTEAYRGEGWYEDEVIQGRTAVWAGADGLRARVFLRGDGSGPYRLRVSWLPFTYAGAPPQKVQVTVNGIPVTGWEVLPAGWQDVTYVLPPGIVRDHTNEIAFHFAWTRRPRDVFASRRTIGRTGVTVPVDVEITAFDRGAYMVTVEDDGTRHDVSYGRRGYNVTVLDPRTGQVLAKTGFDTFANEYESQHMADFIATLPDGVIVLVATKGDAARHLTDAAVEALRSLGAQEDLREHPGAYHALVGVKGARPGTAEEVVDTPSAYIRLGGYPDFRSLGIAVDRVALEPVREEAGRVWSGVIRYTKQQESISP